MQNCERAATAAADVVVVVVIVVTAVDAVDSVVAEVIFSVVALNQEKWQILYSALICNLEQETQSLRE